MSRTKSDIEKLKLENMRLKVELKKMKSSSNNQGFNSKRFFKWVSMVLAGGLFVAASILFYVGMTLTNTNRFMEVASPLIQQPAIQQAVAKETTTALFNQINVEELATEVLPDKVDFLAPQIASQIQTASTNEAEKILASPKFQSIWDNTLETAHAKLITSLKNYEGDGTISINEVFTKLSSDLSNTKLSFLSGKSLPPSIGNITLIESNYLPIAHNVVSNIDAARIITILLLIGLLSLVVFLSSDRRKGLIHVGLLIGILSFALLVSLRIGRLAVSNEAQPEYQQAAIEAWNVIFNPYKLILWGQMLFGFALSGIAWIGGSSKSATSTRSRVSTLLEGNLRSAIFRGQEYAVNRWVGKNKPILLGIIATGFVLSFLFINISSLSVLISSMTALVIAAIVLVVGTPDN